MDPKRFVSNLLPPSIRMTARTGCCLLLFIASGDWRIPASASNDDSIFLTGITHHNHRTGLDWKLPPHWLMEVNTNKTVFLVSLWRSKAAQKETYGPQQRSPPQTCCCSYDGNFVFDFADILKEHRQLCAGAASVFITYRRMTKVLTRTSASIHQALRARAAR